MVGALKRGVRAHMAEPEVSPDTFPEDGSGSTAQACSQGRGGAGCMASNTSFDVNSLLQVRNPGTQVLWKDSKHSLLLSRLSGPQHMFFIGFSSVIYILMLQNPGRADGVDVVAVGDPSAADKRVSRTVRHREHTNCPLRSGSTWTSERPAGHSAWVRV